MAEVLLEDGYRSFGIVTNPHLTDHNGFHQGFQTYYSDLDWHYSKNNAEKVNKTFIDWLNNSNNPSKFFGMLFYIDPHVPYNAPPPFDNKFNKNYKEEKIHSPKPRGKYSPAEIEHIISNYDAEIYYFDYQLGKLIDELKVSGNYNNTLIILAADHGEEFWEHNRYGHGQSLYEELLHVPLIIKLPKAFHNKYLKHKNIQQNMLVSNVDILPTIIGLLDIKIGEKVWEQFAGKNIFRNYNHDKNGGEFSPFVFTEHFLKEYGPYKLRGIITKEWKYIITYEDKDKQTDKLPMVELYNLKDDPTETINLLNQKPNVAKKLNDMLDQQAKKLKTSYFTPMQSTHTKDVREKLKALGYIN